MLRLAFILALFATPALAQSAEYLIEPDQATCLARSAQQCAALGCDGVHSVYWWPCVGPLSAGQAGNVAVPAGAYALKITPGTPYDVTTSNAASQGLVGLSAAEQQGFATPIEIEDLEAAPDPSGLE